MKPSPCTEGQENTTPRLSAVLEQALEQGKPLDFDENWLPYTKHRVRIQGQQDAFDLYVSYEGSATLFYRDAEGKIHRPITAEAGAPFPEHLQLALENALEYAQTAFSEPVASRRSASRRLLAQTITLQTA